MKTNKGKGLRCLVVLAVLLGMLLTPGCRKEIIQEPAVPESTPPATEPTESTVPAEEPPQAQEVPESGDPSLLSLRQAMVGTPQAFAAAYFGCPENADPAAAADPFAIMRENGYWLCEDLPFLLEIPQDRILGETGELFCIVPGSENGTLTVSRGSWDEESGQTLYGDVIYSSETGDPILLFCNADGWEPDSRVVITDDEGAAVTWYPQTDDNNCAMPLRGDDWEALFLDFSPYREILMARHRNMKDGEWVMPTADMLAGSAWQWTGCLKDGREAIYRLIFQENTLSVIWNDGFDEADHEYLFAPWELTYDEGFAILSIDFGTFAGVLSYDLLYHEGLEQLYVGMDVVQEEMPIGWEAQYRFLSRTVGPEPVAMVGEWALAWTEVEGDRNEAEPGECTVTVQSAASGGLLMSYTSSGFPHQNFQDALLTICMREMYSGCGNNGWMAELAYVGLYDTTYAVTLTVDDILIKQNYFLVDGAPRVSYECFIRRK